MSSALLNESPDARQRVMSWSAYDLQVRATAHAATSGQPGFVPDGYLEHLDDLGIQATLTADELCTVSVWERAEGGYRILHPGLVRQREDEALPALAPEAREEREEREEREAGKPEPQPSAWAQLAKPIVVTPSCATCGTPVARIELVAPGQLPAQWEQWPSTVQTALVRERQPGQWHLLVAGPAAGNGYGDPVDTAKAGQIAWAFQPPLRFAQVRVAGVYDNAGFCPDCDAPYCYQHWHVSETGHGSCPHGHASAWTVPARP